MTLEEVVFLFANKHIGRLSAVYRWRIPTTFPSGKLTPTDCPATNCKNLKAALNTAWKIGNEVNKANLERWYVVDFGGVRGNKLETLSHYSQMTNVELVQLGKQGIASWSKMLCVRDPIKYQIFDARVAISLNCLLHSNDLIGQGIFPILASQNQKIMRANKLLHDIQPRPPLRHEFYTEYCTVLQKVAGKLTTLENPVSAMDLEMLLFALAENLIEENLIQ